MSVPPDQDSDRAMPTAVQAFHRKRVLAATGGEARLIGGRIRASRFRGVRGPGPA